ncbi:MAG: hypothetical protein KA436_00185 [Oligoflexales bacterium]|nr:hypothetical protein [Oligoflexales bacterium]
MKISSSFFGKILSVGYLTIMILSLAACNKAPEQKTSAQSLFTANPTLTDSGNTTDPTSVPQTDPDAGRLHPSMVRTAFEKKIEFAATSVSNDQNLKFPIISIDKRNSDYVEIMRCNGSYSLNTLTGAKTNNQKEIDIDELKWAWTLALSDYRHCKLVSEFTTQKTYTDISADTGNFYYVINPCISKEHSLTKRAACSYRFEKSEKFDFVNKFKEKVREKSFELANAESELTGYMYQVQMLSKNLESALASCEMRIAHDDRLNSVKRGLIQGGFYIAGFLIGSALGDITKGCMAGQMAMNFGSQIVNEKLGLMPILNSCVSGAEAFADSADVPAATRARGVFLAQRYEAEYGVKGMLDQLEILTKKGQEGQDGEIKDGGLIQLAIKRISTILTEMNQLDGTILNINSALAKTQKYIDEGGLENAPPASKAEDVDLGALFKNMMGE